MGKGGQSLTSIAAKAHVTPTTLMVFNGLKASHLKPNMTLHFPEIQQVVASPGKTKGDTVNHNIKEYQIYSANAKCYTMVYAVAKTARRDEQFLAIFAFKKNAWVEIDRIEFVHPIRWSLTQQISLLSPDLAGEDLPPFNIDSEDIGHPWPKHLLFLKTNITQKQHRLMEVDHDR
jgi:hypothetical protein